MKRILVADDSVTIQKVIALTFADEPYEVQSVGTGAEALELMNSWKPDILLADVIMPQMNGYELCRAVKGEQQTASLPVLLLAGTFEAFDEEEARSVGADDFITKPFESGELIEKVSVLTGGKPADQVRQEPQPAAPVAPSPAEEPKVTAAAGGGQEPDIWDILSDTEGGGEVPDSGVAGAAVPGMGPLEDQRVVDVGSFDVGLDRPDQAAAPTEAPFEGLAEAPSVLTEQPLEPQPPAPPDILPADKDSVTLSVEDQAELSAEKSRVEDKEKDFFGFETEGPESASDADFLGEAVEEITFDVEKPTATGDEAGQEASFVVPEPAEDQIPVTGETISPEIMAPDSPEITAEEQPSSLELPESLEEPVPKAEFGETVPQFEGMAEAAISEPSPLVELPTPPEVDAPEAMESAVTEAVPEPSTGVQVPETQPEPLVEMEPKQPPGAPPVDLPAGLDEAGIRKVIEEKVEKIVWEVVPEMAEILIREAIEKVKGGS